MEIETLRLVKERGHVFSVALYTKDTFNARISCVDYIGVYKRHCNGVWQFTIKNGGYSISIFAQKFEFVDETQ